nr:hypothetical protein [uncultured Noviherbaspirillum sp.]
MKNAFIDHDIRLGGAGPATHTARRGVIDNGVVGKTNEGSTLVSRFIASSFPFVDPDTRPY